MFAPAFRLVARDLPTASKCWAAVTARAKQTIPSPGCCGSISPSFHVSVTSSNGAQATTSDSVTSWRSSTRLMDRAMPSFLVGKINHQYLPVLDQTPSHESEMMDKEPSDESEMLLINIKKQRALKMRKHKIKKRRKKQMIRKRFKRKNEKMQK